MADVLAYVSIGYRCKVVTALSQIRRNARQAGPPSSLFPSKLEHPLGEELAPGGHWIGSIFSHA